MGGGGGGGGLTSKSGGAPAPPALPSSSPRFSATVCIASILVHTGLYIYIHFKELTFRLTMGRKFCLNTHSKNRERKKLFSKRTTVTFCKPLVVSLPIHYLLSAPLSSLSILRQGIQALAVLPQSIRLVCVLLYNILHYIGPYICTLGPRGVHNIEIVLSFFPISQ